MDYIKLLDADQLASVYDSVIAKILDRLVPLQKVTIRKRPSDPWFNDACREEANATPRAPSPERQDRGDQNVASCGMAEGNSAVSPDFKHQSLRVLASDYQEPTFCTTQNVANHRQSAWSGTHASRQPNFSC